MPIEAATAEARQGYVPQRYISHDPAAGAVPGSALRKGFRDGVSYEDLYQRLSSAAAADEYLLLADYRGLLRRRAPHGRDL